MKLFITLILSAFAAFGSTSVNLKTVPFSFSTSYHMTFEYNAKLGKAWVNINSYEFEDDNYENVRVEGLSYKDGEVVYSMDGTEVVCAYRRRFLGLWPTGNCAFSVVHDYVEVDNWYRGSARRRMTYINMNVQ